MNTETKGKPIGKILLIFFLVLAFTGIGILLQVFVRQSTDLTAKKDSESEIQKQIENKNKEIAGLEKEKEKISASKKRKNPYGKSYFEAENTAGNSNEATNTSSPNAAKKSALFETLRQLRLQIAKEESVPPYIVFTDKTLIDMCEKLPGTESEMLDVSGVGQNKLKKYGQRFLQEISSFLSNNN